MNTNMTRFRRFPNSLHSCVLDERSFCIGRVRGIEVPTKWDGEGQKSTYMLLLNRIKTNPCLYKSCSPAQSVTKKRNGKDTNLSLSVYLHTD